jgi:hypothetical protein
MKLDIIGNIKLDETKPERIRYCLACIESLLFLRNHCKFILNLDSPSPELFKQILNKLRACRFDFDLMETKAELNQNYGEKYCFLLGESNADYILNFHEDHFTVCNDLTEMSRLLKASKNFNASVIRCSFNAIEKRSCANIKSIYNGNDLCVFEMNWENFPKFRYNEYQRYFWGTNAILTKEFAQKIWDRKFNSLRPHEWEISGYNEELKHICVVPQFEIQASIDDPHGEENSHLLARQEHKFWTIYNNIKI